MRVLVTGSGGHLGEALVRVLLERGYAVTGLDLKPSPYRTYSTMVGSVAGRAVVRDCVAGADAVLHTATLHKPHEANRRLHQLISVWPDQRVA